MKTTNLSRSTHSRLTVALACAILSAGCTLEATEDGDVEDETAEENVSEVSSPITIVGIVTPSSLCVKARDASNSGTTNDLWLAWFDIHNERVHACEITDTIGTNETKCCSPTIEEDWEDPGTDVSHMALDMGEGTDGLRVDSVTVKWNGFLGGAWIMDSATVGAFTDDMPSGSCQGCVLGFDCNSCWLDGDDHGKSTYVRVDFDVFQLMTNLE